MFRRLELRAGAQVWLQLPHDAPSLLAPVPGRRQVCRWFASQAILLLLQLPGQKCVQLPDTVPTSAAHPPEASILLTSSLGSLVAPPAPPSLPDYLLHTLEAAASGRGAAASRDPSSSLATAEVSSLSDVTPVALRRAGTGARRADLSIWVLGAEARPRDKP